MATPKKICQVCGNQLSGRRDAKTCSSTCRKRLQRARYLLRQESAELKHVVDKAEDSLVSLEKKMVPAGVGINEDGFIGDFIPVKVKPTAPQNYNPPVPPLVDVSAFDAPPESDALSREPEVINQSPTWLPIKHPWWKQQKLSGLALSMIAMVIILGGFSAWLLSQHHQTVIVKPAAAKLSNGLIPVDYQNKKLSINFDTTITGGKSLTLTGPVVIQNDSDSTGVFKIQTADGSTILAADTLNRQINIGNKPPGQVSLSVRGDISINGSLVSTTNGYSLANSDLSLGGRLICTANGCVGSGPTIDTANLAYLNASQTFSGDNIFQNAITVPGLQTTNNSHNVSLGFTGTALADTSYLFDLSAGSGTQTICTVETGNCAGTGSGVTTLGGTTNQLAKFTGAQTIGDSIISDNGSTVTVSGILNATTLQQGGVGVVLQNTNFGGDVSGTYNSISVDKLKGTALSITSLSDTNFLVYNSTSGNWENHSIAGDLVIDHSGVASIQPDSVALGTDTTGDYVQNLGTLTGLNTSGNSGEGSTPSLSVAYGSGANTAVQGNTTITCAAGTGNLTGGGNSVTLGAGGSCNTIDTVNNPTFSGLIQGTGGLTLTGTTQINNSGSASTSIGASATGGTITIGNTSGTDLALQDAQWNVTGAGAATFASITNNGNYNSNTFTSSALAFGANLGATIDASGANTISIGGTSTGDILLGGGSSSTGCTLTNSSGDFTCTGNITGASTGTAGYWSRSGTTLQPATVGDSVTTSGNISTTGSGTITSAGLLTASSGLTVTGTTQINNSGSSNTSIGASATGGTITIGNTSGTDLALQDAQWNVTGAGAATLASITNNGTYNGNTFTSTRLAFSAASTATIDSASSQQLSLGDTNATAVNLGNTTNTTAILLQGAAAATYTIGSTNTTGTIALGRSTDTNEIDIGNANTADTKVQTIKIGAGTGVTTGKSVVTVGSTANASSLTLQAGSAGISLNGATTVSNGNLGLGANSLTLTGSIASSGSRVTKGWFTDLDVTNTITGSVSGNAATATALAANPSDCAANNFATTIAANGNLTCSTVDASILAGTTLASGVTASSLTSLGILTGLTISGTANITSTSVTALTVASTSSNYGLQVDESTTSAVTGLKIKAGAAGAAGGLGLSVINGNAAENLTIDAKGAGTVTINGTATGNITLSRATTIASTLTVQGTTFSIGNGSAATISTPSGAASISIQPNTTGALNLATTNTGDVNVGNGAGNVIISGASISVDNAGAISAGGGNFGVSSLGVVTATFAASGGSSHAVCKSGSGTTLSTLRACAGTPIADYAELYPTESTVHQGDIVMPSGNYVTSKDGKYQLPVLKATQTSYDSGEIGVISEQTLAGNSDEGALIGNNINSSDNPQGLALNGRVMTKVDTENGNIAPGDYITASSTPGVGMKATHAGEVVGRALAAYSGSGVSQILVFINPSYYNPDTNLQGDNGTFDLVTANGITVHTLTVNGTATFNGDIVVNGHIVGNPDTSGAITLSAGASSLTHSFSSSFNSAPNVVITPENDPGGLRYWITKDQNSFTIHLSGAAASDIKFDYFVQQ